MRNNYYIVIGLILLIPGLLIIAFRTKISKIYDRMNLSEKEKNYYKKYQLTIISIILISAGFIYSLLYFLPEDIIEKYKSMYNIDKNLFFLISGIAAIGYSIFTVVVRLLKKENIFFIKHEAMIRTYGEYKGRFFHILSYTVVPFCIGVFLIVKSQGLFFIR